MKIATTTADYYASSNNRVSPAEAVEKIAGTHFKALDISFCNLEHESLLGGNRWEYMIDDAGEAAARNGMIFSGAHTPMGPTLDQGLEGQEFLELTRRSLEGAAKLGIKWSVVHIEDIPGPFCREHIKFIFKRNLDFFKKLYMYMTIMERWINIYCHIKVI